MNGEAAIKNNTVKINAITLIFVTAFMLFLNFNCGYISDDWHFKFVFTETFPTDGSRYIQSFADIITSAQNYRNLFGGRVLCHSLIFFINMFGKPIFNIINSLMFTVLGYLAYTFIKSYTKTNYRFMLPAVYVIFILFLPRFGDNCLWLSGSVNYLWSGVILLSCFLCINRYAQDPTPIKTLLLCVPVFISSLTNEMTGGMIVIYILLTFTLEHKFKWQSLILLMPAIAGAVFVLTAPGNFVRMENDLPQSVGLGQIVLSLFDHINTILYYFYIFIIISIFALFFTIKYNRSLKPFMGGLKLSAVGIAGILALSLTGENSFRPYFIGCVPLISGSIICAVNVFEQLSAKRSNDTKGLCRILSLASLICIICRSLCLIISHTRPEPTALVSLAVMTALFLVSLVIPYAAEMFSAKGIGEKIKSSMGSPQKYIPLAVIIAIVPYLTINTAIYISNANTRKIWFENAGQYIKDGKYEYVLELEAPVDFTGIFDPDDSYCFDNSPYVISWFAYDNGVYIDLTDENKD
ncbi:MAG: DUF6056 family protein [Oscillospiraceae bacterium]